MGQARRYHTQQVHYLRLDLAGADGAGTLDVGTIPAGSIVIDAGVIVSTAFNGTGTLSLGTAADTDGFASALVITSAGKVGADDLGASDDIYVTSDTDIKAVVGGTPTAGAGHAYITFIPADDG